MGKNLQPNKDAVRALNTYVKLMRAAESVTARTHRHLATLGLTLSQFAVLEALYHLGPLSQRQIGQKILRSSGNITMVIDNLEKRGLAQRKRSETDRRYFIVHLTHEGLADQRHVTERQDRRQAGVDGRHVRDQDQGRFRINGLGHVRVRGSRSKRRN